MKNNKNKWYIKIWREGKVLDFWSINHTLCGGVCMVFFNIIGLSVWFNLFLTILILVSWEMWEKIMGIKEFFYNKIFDVLTGLVGFIFINFLIKIYDKYLVFSIIFISFILLEVCGYLAYKKRGKKRFN